MLQPARIKGLHGLHAIADAGIRPDLALADKVAAFVAAGCSTVQLRMKGLSSRQQLEAARAARAACHAAGVLLIVNDRADIASMAEADGAHLGAEDLPIHLVRRELGPSFILGATARTLDEARDATRAGADYVGYGPIYGTRSKSLEVPPRGVEALAQVVAGCPIPVIAIGGIDLQRIGEVARAGAAGAAVISAAVDGDPVVATRALVQAFERARA